MLGESGSGKSTLLAVLLGFLTPTAGTITVDGVDAARFDPDELRTLFAWCDQRAHLFDSSLAENVRLARPGADDEQITAALAAAGAGDWVAGLPDGLDTRVGEHGQAVSGGERQRVALARAVLADRPVLLADEPAAHLDPATADAVTNLILRPAADRCVVLVTHRPDDARLADVVVRLERGGGAAIRSGSGRWDSRPAQRWAACSAAARRSAAYTAACDRRCMFRQASSPVTEFLIVFSATPSRSPISRLVMPSPIRARICSCRGVRPGVCGAPSRIIMRSRYSTARADFY